MQNIIPPFYYQRRNKNNLLIISSTPYWYGSIVSGNVQSVDYQRRNENHLCDKAHDSKWFVHFVPTDGGRHIEADHAGDHAHAVKEQGVGLQCDGSAIHRHWQRALDEPRQTQTQ